MNLAILRLVAACLQTVFALQQFHQTGEAANTNQVVYASFTSSVEKYLEALDAQVDTWAAKPLAEDRYYCVGDRELVRAPADKFLAVDCGMSPSELACKMGYLFVEAARRDPAWLVVVQTDMYINMSMYEGLLAQYDHTQPIALGPAFGCGCTGIMSGCNETYERGGFCGGGVYAISGAAVRQMVAGSEDAFIAKMNTFVASRIPEDMANSCAMHQAGVHLYRFIDEYSRLFVNLDSSTKTPIWDENAHLYKFIDEGWPIEDLKARIGEGIYSMHPVSPKMIYWLQALDDRDDAARELLEQELFVNGQCVGCARAAESSMIQKRTRRVVNISVPDGVEVHTCT